MEGTCPHPGGHVKLVPVKDSPPAGALLRVAVTGGCRAPRQALLPPHHGQPGCRRAVSAGSFAHSQLWRGRGVSRWSREHTWKPPLPPSDLLASGSNLRACLLCSQFPQALGTPTPACAVQSQWPGLPVAWTAMPRSSCWQCDLLLSAFPRHVLSARGKPLQLSCLQRSAAWVPLCAARPQRVSHDVRARPPAKWLPACPIFNRRPPPRPEPFSGMVSRPDLKLPAPRDSRALAPFKPKPFPSPVLWGP